MRYSISDLEKLSGVKAHTIRIWEKRYALLRPMRTGGNIRYYDEQQLKKLLHTASLIASGMKISAVSKLNPEEMRAAVDKVHDSQADARAEIHVHRLIEACADMDERLFEHVFNNALLGSDLVTVFTGVVNPLLNRVGYLWSVNDMLPAEEHFVTSIVRRKLFAAIDSIPLPESSRESWVLFLPDDEEHEVNLLLSAFLLRQSGRKVVYLGSQVPMDNLSQVIDKVNPTHLQFFWVRKHAPEKVQGFIDALHAKYPKLNKVMSINPLFDNTLSVPSAYQITRSIEEFLEIL